ncbi:MAG: N-acetyl sugar amidotransferase, partial [Prosthecobacter sp.]
MSETLETYYGLPAEVKFCSQCVISNQRPNSAVEYEHTSKTKKTTIRFDEEMVCDACRTGERKKAEVDWEAREKELWKLCDLHRKDNGEYDCLVPGSGGKDSFY